MLHDCLQAKPGLFGCGQDLTGWQEEAVSTCVSQFKGKGVFDARVIGPVDASTTGLVWGANENKVWLCYSHWPLTALQPLYQDPPLSRTSQAPNCTALESGDSLVGGMCLWQDTRLIWKAKSVIQMGTMLGLPLVFLGALASPTHLESCLLPQLAFSTP